MKIGVPREIKIHEYRVGLVPASVAELVRDGHEVLVETGAGLGIGDGDDVYIAAGAKIAPDAAAVFAAADLIVKVKEPQPPEIAMLRSGQALFTYLHLAPDPDQAKGLMASGVTAIAYETVTDAAGGLPLLAPMSEVAGRMATQVGAHYLEKAQGGKGVLLGGVPGVAPPHPRWCRASWWGAWARARSSSMSPSTRADASQRRGRPPMPIRFSSPMASPITA
jgi:alanine dehydrogenase